MKRGSRLAKSVREVGGGGGSELVVLNWKPNRSETEIKQSTTTKLEGKKRKQANDALQRPKRNSFTRVSVCGPGR